MKDKAEGDIKDSITMLLTSVVLLTTLFIGYLGTYERILLPIIAFLTICVYYLWRIIIPKDLKRIKGLSSYG